jgi:hypothetical protein
VAGANVNAGSFTYGTTALPVIHMSPAPLLTFPVPYSSHQARTPPIRTSFICPPIFSRPGMVTQRYFTPMALELVARSPQSYSPPGTLRPVCKVRYMIADDKNVIDTARFRRNVASNPRQNHNCYSHVMPTTLIAFVMKTLA